MSWKEAVGRQIRDARERAGITQDDLAIAVGKSRQTIILYEAGSVKLSPDTLGKIAIRLGMAEVNVNGYRFSIEYREDAPAVIPNDQFKLDFDKEHIFPGAVIKISPTRMTITISATAPLKPAA